MLSNALRKQYEQKWLRERVSHSVFLLLLLSCSFRVSCCSAKTILWCSPYRCICSAELSLRPQPRSLLTAHAAISTTVFSSCTAGQHVVNSATATAASLLHCAR